MDTNVLLYAFSQDEPPKRERAQSLLDRLWQSGEGRLSTQVLQEFYVNATRKLPHPVSPEGAQAIVLSLSVLFSVPLFRSLNEPPPGYEFDQAGELVSAFPLRTFLPVNMA